MPMNKQMDRMLGSKEVREITGLAVSTIYDGMALGWFPRNIRISPKRVAWRESEIRNYLNSRPTYKAA
jgi:prophage regulatory protein